MDIVVPIVVIPKGMSADLVMHIPCDWLLDLIPRLESKSVLLLCEVWISGRVESGPADGSAGQPREKPA